MQNSENRAEHSLVMLVDDSSIDNFVNRKIIQRYQFASEVIEFTKASSALKHLLELNNNLEKEIPSLLFLDLEMPEINGLEFLSAFTLLSDRIKKNMNIVILTSSINPADVKTCSKFKSVLTFLPKPLMKNNLDTIEKLIAEKAYSLVEHSI